MTSSRRRRTNAAVSSRCPSPRTYPLRQNPLQKIPCARVLRIREERIWHILLYDTPSVHEYNPVRHLTGEPHFMGYAYHRHALLSQGGHGIKHLFNHFGVERRG